MVTDMLEQITSLAPTFSEPAGSYRSGSPWGVQALGTIGASDGPLAAAVLKRIVDEAAMLGQVPSVAASGVAGSYSEPTSALADQSWRIVPTAKSTYREREILWLRANRDALRSFVGTWVVIEAGEVVAHGKHLGEVVREAKSKGIRSPFVHRVGAERPTGEAEMGV